MKKRDVISGAIWNALGSLLYGLNSMLMLTAVNRTTSIEMAGTFGIAYTTAQLLYIVGVFGANHYQMTDYAHVYSYKSYFRLKIVTCGIMFPCAVIVYALGMGSNSFRCLFLLTLLMACNAFGELYQSLFFQHSRLDLSGQSLFFRTLWTDIAFIAVMVISQGKLNVALVVACAVNAIGLWYYGSRRSEDFRYESSEDSGVKYLAKTCVPLFASVFLMNLVLSMPKYGIEIFLDRTVQGYFNMIFMPVQVINMCVQFIFKPMLAKYAALLTGGESQRFLHALGKQVLLLAGFTLMCSAGAYLIGSPVLGLIYGADLSSVRLELTVLILGSGIFALCQLLYYVLVILRKNRRIMRIYLIGTVAAVFSCVVLIPRADILGACLSFVITHFVLAVGYLMEITKAIVKKDGMEV